MAEREERVYRRVRRRYKTLDQVQRLLEDEITYTISTQAILLGPFGGRTESRVGQGPAPKKRKRKAEYMTLRKTDPPKFYLVTAQLRVSDSPLWGVNVSRM